MSAIAQDALGFHAVFSDPGIPPPSLVLSLDQHQPPYTLDDMVMDPIESCSPSQASLCSVQNAIQQVSRARSTACPELEASPARREAALDVLRIGNFSLEDFGSTGFDVFVFAPNGEVLADPLRPDLVGSNIASRNYTGPERATDVLLDYVAWVTKWGGGFVSHHDIRLEGGEPAEVATYIESCPGTGDRFAVSFKTVSAPSFADCSRETNSVCARQNVNVVFGRALVDMLTVNSQMGMSDLWYDITYSSDYRVDNFSSTIQQLTWAGHPNTSIPSVPNTLGTIVGSGFFSKCVGLNTSGCLNVPSVAEGLMENLGQSAWRGNFYTFYPVAQQAGEVAGIVWNNTVYALTSTLRHAPHAVLDGPFCTTCTANVTLVCSLANAEALVSHATVDQATPGFSWDRITYDPWLGASHDNIHDGEKIWPDGFYIVAYNSNGTCVADGHDPSNIGKTALEIFGNEDAHQFFLVAASMNARWMPFEAHGESRLGYVNSLRIGGEQNYVMVSISRASADWDMYGDCTIWASESCSNWRAQVSVGVVAGEAVACLDENCLLKLAKLYDIGEDGGIGADGVSSFPVHIYDSDLGCWSEAEAHGLDCPPEFDSEMKTHLLRQLGSDPFTTAVVNVGYGWEMVAFIYSLHWRAVGATHSQVFHFVTFTVRDVIEPMCTSSSDCPTHSSCSSETGRCACDSGYLANLSLVPSECGGFEPTEMTCVYVDGQDCTSSTGSLDLSTCQDCRGGFFCADGISTSCPLGQYCPGNTSTTYPCPAGRIGNATELSECFACQPGTSSPKVGGQNCIDCAPGAYSELWGQTSCNLCPTGFYSAGSQTSCDKCPDGTYTSGAGASSVSECRFCRDGYYFNDGSCWQCPFGFDSTDSGDTSCQILTSIVVAVPSSFFGLLLLSWLLLVVLRKFRARVRVLQRVADEAAEDSLRKAKENIEEFGHPMVLVPAMTLLHMSIDQLAELHEGSRDAHRLVFIDSMDRCQELRNSGSKIILLSYQLPFSARSRCPSDVQFLALKTGLREALSQCHWDVFDTFVWMDILSLPQQAHPEMRKLATSSCYIYSKFCDIFLAVCPTIAYEHSGEVVDLESYRSSARARVQVLSFCCARGPQSVFIFDERGLRRAPSDFAAEMAYVFQGERRCCRLGHGNGTLPCEGFGMMLPMLGLYVDNAGCKRKSHRNKSLPGVEFFDRCVKPHKDVIFPQLQKYEFQSENSSRSVTQMRELFGDLLERVDFHCKFTSLLERDMKGEEEPEDRFHDPFESEAHSTMI